MDTQNPRPARRWILPTIIGAVCLIVGFFAGALVLSFGYDGYISPEEHQAAVDSAVAEATQDAGEGTGPTDGEVDQAALTDFTLEVQERGYREFSLVHAQKLVGYYCGGDDAEAALAGAIYAQAKVDDAAGRDAIEAGIIQRFCPAG